MIKRRLFLAALAFVVVAWFATADALTRRLPFDEKAFAQAQASGRSILVDVPIDPDQVIGLNPRLYNLTTDTYL